MSTTAGHAARIKPTHRKQNDIPPPASTADAPVHDIVAARLPRYLQRKQADGATPATGEPAVDRTRVPRYLHSGLEISQPGDVYEREADSVADKVLRMPDATAHKLCAACAAGAPCANCAPGGVIQRSANAATGAPAASAVASLPGHTGPGQPLDSTTRAYFEPRFGRDFSAVRVHAGSAAAQSARELSANAYTLGQDVVFGEGRYAPSTPSGRQLLAHELAHVVQQSGGARIMRDAEQATAAVSSSVAPARPDPYQVVPAPSGATAIATAQPTYIMNTKGAFVATVSQGTVLKVTGVPNPDNLEAVQQGQFWAKPGDTQPGLYDLYYEVEYFGRMSGAAVDKPIRGYVYSSWLALNGAAPGKSTALLDNDWMNAIPDSGQTGDKEAIIKAATAIKAARAGIEARAFATVEKSGPTIPREGLMSKEDERTKAYANWLDDPGTRPSLATGTDDIRWLAFKGVFPAEGNPSTIMTYDNTNITWGVGFSGAGRPGVGATEQMMARLFNQSAASWDAFWRAGITVVGTDLVAVKISNAETGKAEKLRGTKAENFVRTQKDLLSLMTNVTLGLHTAGQKDPDSVVRQQNLDAQFETFLSNTLAGSDGIIEGLRNDPKAAAVAAHSVHSGQHGWGQYRGVTSLAGVRSAIDSRILAMQKQNDNAKAAGGKPKFSFIVPRSQIEAHIK